MFGLITDTDSTLKSELLYELRFQKVSSLVYKSEFDSTKLANNQQLCNLIFDWNKKNTHRFNSTFFVNMSYKKEISIAG